MSKVIHQVDPRDIAVQPSPGNGLLVFVSGQLSIDDGAPLRFAQVFNLQPIPNQPGGLFVLNDLFRLNIG